MKLTAVLLSGIFALNVAAAPQIGEITRTIIGEPTRATTRRPPRPTTTDNWNPPTTTRRPPRPTTTTDDWEPPTTTKRPTTTTKQPTTTTKKPTTTTKKPEPTSDPNGPNVDEVYIISAGYGGSGCPQGSANVQISDKGRAMTVIFDQYVAEAGPGVPSSMNRKNCQINVNLHYPGGYQYSILSSDYRGYVKLDDNVQGIQAATYYFSGEQAQSRTQSILEGPKEDDYLIHDEVPFSSTVWSPCGRNSGLNINSEVRINNANNRNGHGIMMNDSLDNKVVYVMGIKWQKC